MVCELCYHKISTDKSVCDESGLNCVVLYAKCYTLDLQYLMYTCQCGGEGGGEERKRITQRERERGRENVMICVMMCNKVFDMAMKVALFQD